MFYLIRYLIVGLIAGVIAKKLLNMQMTTIWTISLGVVGSILGGSLTYLFMRPAKDGLHVTEIIFSIVGAILILFVVRKLNIQLPQFR
jgi:uncharacterized membrane protein YeaQ/YmgE (transglycosylase-associated protein family)